MLPKSIPLLLLFSAVSVPCTAFESLRFLIIRPDDGNVLPDQLERALQAGVARIQDAIYATPLTDHVVKSEDVLDCLKLDSHALHTGTARMLLPQGARKPSKVLLNDNITLNNANFAILVDINKERCENESELMASANPCYVRDEHRPAIARIRVCPQLPRWDDFLKSNTAQDVFRHELLHALGWGTVVHPKNSTFTPDDIYLNWNMGRTAQSVARKFLDYGNAATDFARIHFSCPQLEGIESERRDKMHLSEYIFGNELMTPVISTAANYFTEISARILEETHLGAEQWYAVDRSIIDPEMAAYSYGRGWGCDFVTRSCYDYIDHRLREGRSTFPFCSSADYRRLDQSLHICNSTSPFPQALKCDNLKLEPQEKSSNGITPQPMMNIFPGIPARLSFRMPSGPETRFCPFIQAISMDTHFASPPFHEIRPC